MVDESCKPEVSNQLLRDVITKPRSEAETQDRDLNVSPSSRAIANAIAATQRLKTILPSQDSEFLHLAKRLDHDIPGSNLRAISSALRFDLERQNSLSKAIVSKECMKLEKEHEKFRRLISPEIREYVKRLSSLVQGSRVIEPPEHVPTPDAPKPPTVPPERSLDPLLDPKSIYSPPEVRIGVEAWAAVLQGGNPRDNGIGVTRSIKKWLIANKSDLETRHKVRITSRTIDRIATVFNWHKDGGLPSRKK